MYCMVTVFFPKRSSKRKRKRSSNCKPFVSFREFPLPGMVYFYVCFILILVNQGNISQWIKQLNDPIEVVDPEVTDIIELEKARQWKAC